MIFQLQQMFLSSFLFLSCTTGNLKVIADLPTNLKEISAVEIVSGSDLIWVIEDAGNANNLYGLNKKGQIIKKINISNSKNVDWEDLTSDDADNLYIGDFGNNSRKRKNFTILKIAHPENYTTEATAEKITFKLPKDMKSLNFESFFVYEGSFYIFSKDSKNCVMVKVPNEVGEHTAEFVSEINLKGKHNLVTSADISNDGKTVVLLNHEKVWKLSEFKSDHFFEGKIEELDFDNDSQKEGVCFHTNSELYITDESHGNTGNNLYSFALE